MKLFKKQRATTHSAGYDIPVIKGATIRPGEIHTFETDCALDIKEDEVALIFSRSSVGFKKDLMLVNSVGVIDSDFHPNELKVRVYNFGEKTQVIEDGERLAQAVIVKYETLTEEIIPEQLRDGGIGSTNA